MTEIEIRRQNLQIELDSGKTMAERNRLGQFSTPYPLACQICAYMKKFTGESVDSFLEPAIGTGVFYSALSEMVDIRTASGYEIDSHYFYPAKQLWNGHNIKILNKDFLDVVPEEKFSLIIANPPYSRHHHMPSGLKSKLAGKIESLYNMRLSGLAGLHIYFAILATQWLKEDGYSCWLLPSEFLSVNYGVEFKSFLLNQVDLVAIHTYDNTDVQFDDALVSSSIVVFRKSRVRGGFVQFSWGPDINNPTKKVSIGKADLCPEHKWNHSFLLEKEKYSKSELTIGSFFNIKRGIATGDNNFFIVDKNTIETFNIPITTLSPLIPPPRQLQSKIYTREQSTEDGLFLLTCHDPIETIKEKSSGLYEYLEKGIAEGVNLRANCRNRKPWYGLEKREPAPILVSYMGRKSVKSDIPLKFILNQTDAIATNSYLCLYLKDEYRHAIDSATYKTIWQTLSSIPTDMLMAYGRTYGGGLLKWEPKELGGIPCPNLSKCLKSRQPSLFDIY